MLQSRRVRTRLTPNAQGFPITTPGSNSGIYVEHTRGQSSRNYHRPIFTASTQLDLNSYGWLRSERRISAHVTKLSHWESRLLFSSAVLRLRIWSACGSRLVGETLPPVVYKGFSRRIQDSAVSDKPCSGMPSVANERKSTKGVTIAQVPVYPNSRVCASAVRRSDPILGGVLLQ
ncbi:hypothetical protein BV22DRAFT_122927 [Leucogyrophana mollusca]|uniref:Uncharacterized protein n=1 Tax=Leucogyrophana mollusca TaxID=85980 RepID=A0ACB8BWZ4_9AGAM|nr:hypothetical protein BV22DRAFT_122927 [Leucogyrophana mollusca]